MFRVIRRKHAQAATNKRKPLNVITPEQIQAAEAWVHAFYEDSNSNTYNVERWLTEFYQPDAILSHGNQPPLHGYKEISAYLKEDRKQQSVRHVIERVDVFSDRIYVELDGIYIPKNDPEQKEIIIKEVALLGKDIDENKISSTDIYMDPTPLIEKIKMLS